MGKRVKVTINSMAFKGYGVARAEGRVIFVPYSVTGDEAWIEIVEEKKTYALGRLDHLLVPSPWRVNPQCLYFGRCGGCHWQHIEKGKQEEIKAEIFRETLKRLAGLDEFPSLSIAPSPRSYGYRVRTRLKIRGKGIGYYQERSHRLVDIDHCPISHPFINEILSLLRSERASLFPVEEIEINISPEEKRGVLVLHLPSFSSRVEAFGKDLLRNHPLIKGMVLETKRARTFLGDPSLNFMVSLVQNGEKRTFMFRASPGSFFQVNPEQNQALIQTVLQFAEVKEGERVLDLYAGIGNFTLPLAAVAGEVMGVEENERAVEDARFNAEANGIQQCASSMQGGGNAEELGMGRPDLIVLDPPRTGGKEVVNRIAGLKPKRIVYVSCDPTTLSRDLRLFSENGYSLQETQPHRYVSPELTTWRSSPSLNHFVERIFDDADGSPLQQLGDELPDNLLGDHDLHGKPIALEEIAKSSAL